MFAFSSGLALIPFLYPFEFFLLQEILNVCGTDGHQGLQLLHLKFHPIHFWYQTDQCKMVPVQGNLTVEEYNSEYKWFQANWALVLNEKNDTGNELTQDMFISNIKICDDVRSIVTLEKISPDWYIADRYKKADFMNSIYALYNNLPGTTNTNGRAFCGQSQSNVHSVVPYDVENNNDDWNGPSKYDYCRLGADPNFVSYESLMCMAYSDCDVNSLAYGDKHAEKIFNQGIMAISTNLNHAFDTSRPCAIYGKAGHSFDDCKELKDQAAIWKSYIQLRVAIQKLKGIVTSQRCDINSIRSYKLSYVNSVDLLPQPSPPLDSAAENRLDKLEGMLVSTLKAVGQTNKRINSLTSREEDDDDDEDSQSSLNENYIWDFLKGALK